jgi:hypothetical protein
MSESLIGYKWVRPDGTTFGGCQWGDGVTHETDGVGPLCNSGWLHFYEDKILAVLHAPLYLSWWKDAILWECLIEGNIIRDRIKTGCTRLTTVRIIDAPTVTAEQRIEYAIRCALAVSPPAEFVTWAARWLDGTDRSTSVMPASSSFTPLACQVVDMGRMVLGFPARRQVHRASGRLARGALGLAVEASVSAANTIGFPELSASLAADAAHWALVAGCDLLAIAKQVVR